MPRKKSERQDPEALKRLLHRRKNTPATHLVGEEDAGTTSTDEAQRPPRQEGLAADPSHPGGEDLPVSTTLILSPEGWKQLAVFCFVENRTLRDVVEALSAHLDDLEEGDLEEARKVRKTRRINVHLPESVHNRLRWTALKADTTMNTLVEALIRKVLPEPDPELAATIRRLPRGPKPRR